MMEKEGMSAKLLRRRFIYTSICVVKEDEVKSRERSRGYDHT